MEIYNGVTCVPVAELLERGMISVPYYKKLSRDGRIRVVRRGCRCTPALVEYDTLPWRMKEELQRVYGDPRRAAERSTFVDGVEIDGVAVKFFAEWEFVDKESGQTTRLKAEKQREYVNNASVIRALLRTLRDMQQARRTGGRGVSGFWDKAVVWAEEAMDCYPHSLPSNPRRLKDKCESFVQEGYRVLIHRGYQNDNRQKIDAQVGGVLVRLYSQNTPKLTFEEVGERYNTEIAALLDKPRLTVASIKYYLGRPDVRALWYAPRHGEVQAMNDIMPQARRRKVSAADDIWSIDGSPVQMYYRAGGKLYSDLYLYVVTDAASSAIIGYAMGKTESSQLVLDALCNAMETQGYLPAQLQYDNGSSNTTAAVVGLMSNMTEVAFPCQPYRARAKYVEHIQGHFQSLVQRKYPNFKGLNITARSLDARVNPDAMRRVREAAPTLEELKKQVAMGVMDWNSNSHARDKYGVPCGETPMERYNRPAESRRKVTPFEIYTLYVVDLVNKADAKGRYKYTPRGVEITIDGQLRQFIVPDDDDATHDFQFQRYNQGKMFQVKMNVRHPHFVDLWMDGAFVARAMEKEAISAGIMDARRYGDGHKVRELIDGQRAWTEENRARYEAVATGTDGLVSPLTMDKGAWNRYESGEIDRLNGLGGEKIPSPAPVQDKGNRLADSLAAIYGK